MDALAQIDFVLDLLARMGVEIRHERLDGNGGGLCRLRGRWVLMIDDTADPATRLDRCVQALTAFPESENVHLPAELRERLDAEKRKNS